MRIFTDMHGGRSASSLAPAQCASTMRRMVHTKGWGCRITDMNKKEKGEKGGTTVALPSSRSEKRLKWPIAQAVVGNTQTRITYTGKGVRRWGLYGWCFYLLSLIKK